MGAVVLQAREHEQHDAHASAQRVSCVRPLLADQQAAAHSSLVSQPLLQTMKLLLARIPPSQPLLQFEEQVFVAPFLTVSPAHAFALGARSCYV